jgi:ATP-dependent DNA ligase
MWRWRTISVGSDARDQGLRPAGVVYEIKHDGYRLIVHREDQRVRLFTRNGHDWSSRYPRIVEAALRPRLDSFVLDGEGVLFGVDSIARRKHHDEVQLYARPVNTRAHPHRENKRPVPVPRQHAKPPLSRLRTC